jgi:hypothetical protein
LFTVPSGTSGVVVSRLARGQTFHAGSNGVLAMATF